MGLNAGQSPSEIKVNYVFIGSCTNARIEDFRSAADYVKGKKKAENITAWLVPGSQQVAKQIYEEGLDKIYILYDEIHIRDIWVRHLSWLNEHLPVKTKEIGKVSEWLAI